jgi:PAS domain S-box-containing protein
MNYINNTFTKAKNVLVNTSVFFDGLLKNSRTTAIFVLDKSGTILEINEGVKRYYGYSPEDIIGEYFSILFTEEDIKKRKPELELKFALEKGSVADLNYIVHRNGSPVWTQGETISVTDDSGEIFLVKFVSDMDHQKLLEEIFIASEKKQSLLSGIFDSLPTGIEVFKSIRNEKGETTDFEYALINKAAEKLMRRPRKEMIGKRLLQEYPDFKKNGIYDTLYRVVESGKPENLEYFYNEQGFHNWYKSGFAKFCDGVIANFEDITERKYTHSELEKTTAFLLDTQEVADVCNFEWDMSNDQITGTPALYRLFDFKDQSTTLADFLDIVSGEDRERVRSTILNAKDKGTAVDIEFKTTLADGSVKSLFGRAKPLFNEHHELVKMIGTVVDITHFKKVEGELKKAESELNLVTSEQEERVHQRTEELLKANLHLKKIIEKLDKFANIISHDLRAPLNSLEGLIFLLGEEYREKALDEEGEEMIDLINTKIQNMKELIVHVLKSAKGVRKVKELVNQNLLIQEVIKNLNPPSHLNIIIQNQLPQVHYHRPSLVQIFQNLLGYAIRYMNNELRIIKICSIEYNAYYEMAIGVNSLGISKKNLENIFKQPEVPDADLTMENQGLRLSKVKQLVEEHGGKIWMEGGETSDTYFYFTIPKEQ